MSNNTSDYLTSSIIKNDSWVKGICSAGSAEEMADLIMKRITNPTLYGPGVAYFLTAVSQTELPSHIIYDLVINSYADYELADEAMAIILKKIVNKEIVANQNALENVFNLIEKLVLEKCSDNLYEWIKANISFIDSLDGDKRKTMLNAINALAYAQKEGPGLEDFWLALWEQGNQFWWNAAFHGIRYSDFDKAISFIPQLVDRKCSNISFLLSSMWRMKDDDRLVNAFKKGIRDNDVWAGMAINILASKMKWPEKSKLIERLYDKETDLSTEEEDHMETMGFFGA